MKFLDSNGQIIPRDKLPRLIVLTGLNGSGKTRGLKEINGNSLNYFDYKSFDAIWNKSEESSNRRTIHRQPPFENQMHPMDFHLLENLIKKPENFTDHYFHNKITNIQSFLSSEIINEPLGEITKQFLSMLPNKEKTSIEEQEGILKKDTGIYLKYRDFVKSIAGLNFSEIVSTEKTPLHLYSGSELIRLLSRKDASPLEISLISKINNFLYERTEYISQRTRAGTTYEIAISDFHANNTPPWKELNDILSKIGQQEEGDRVFQFEIQDPEKESNIELGKIGAKQGINEVRLWDKYKSTSLSISNLSSGEKSLLGLATLLHTHNSIYQQPFLCLDEIDASLHPSMIQSMLEILLEQSKFTRIYLATHSPSTVALTPEESLYFVSDGEAKNISKSEAIEGLTQGFFTTEGISSIFRSFRGIDKSVIVISEGKNYEYLTAITEKLNLKEKIHIHPYKPKKSGSTGVTELKVLHELIFNLIDTLPNNKKFVFLLDCDAEKDVDGWLAKTDHPIKAFALKRIDANPAKSGIENIIPASILNEIKTETGIPLLKNNQKGRSINSKYKNDAKKRFLIALESSKIDIETLKYTLSDLISLCSSE